MNWSHSNHKKVFWTRPVRQSVFGNIRLCLPYGLSTTVSFTDLGKLNLVAVQTS